MNHGSSSNGLNKEIIIVLTLKVSQAKEIYYLFLEVIGRSSRLFFIFL